MRTDRDPCADTLRAFNRAFTKRIGVLDDSFLGTGRPLGPSRVLYELGAGPIAVQDLRSGLALDSGYLSRLLRTLEDDGLLRLERNRVDGRRRTATLTAKGRKAWAELDAKSDRLAANIVEVLTQRQKDELEASLATVTRLMAAATITFTVIAPTSPHARECLMSYFAELNERFEHGFEPGDTLTADAPALSPPGGAFVVAYSDSAPVACGGLVKLSSTTAEIKRMWVNDQWRGLGIAPRLLKHLEETARALGYKRVRLDTNKVLVEAIALYERSGYTHIGRYNDNPYAHVWFEKRLRKPRPKR